MAGAREAHGLVTALLARGRKVIASLPEPERLFGDLPVPTRVGRFDGADDFAAWIGENRVSTVLDASHAFDDCLCALVSEVCARSDVRYLRILRPPWDPTARDRWKAMTSIAQAARSLPDDAIAFTNTGWPSLQEYAGFSGRRLYVRQTGEGIREAPFPFVTFVQGQPPFSQFQEQSLFAELAVTHLICRNVGGAASMSKLLAARALALQVLMIERRPPPVQRPTVETVADALAWEACV
jgi:precorrin-6A/cobalt-precorrin-6A reductase